MPRIFALTAKTALIAVVVGGLSACSSVKPEQIAALEGKISSAMSEARSANSTAKAAMDAASSAKATAESAQAAAASAQSAADAAMACCSDNKNRIERMFEQTMRK